MESYIGKLEFKQQILLEKDSITGVFLWVNYYEIFQSTSARLLPHTIGFEPPSLVTLRE